MDLKVRFTEIKNRPLNEDTINSLKTTLSLAKSVQDRVLSMEILLYLSDTLKKLKQFDDSTNLLEQEINSTFFNQKQERLKLTDDLVRTLLLTEDFVKLKSVLNNRNRFITSEHQAVMQKFYLAVAYEGLKDYKKAIEYLQNIKDNISNANLVNKYLKLSMLYLKTKNLKQAKEAYSLAKTFDPQKTNPIFTLCESDIQFYQKDYQGALATYEAYFVLTQNKHRYLDRYILINIELNHLDEAFRFYKEYLEKMNTVVSKNYRLLFYEAALKLNKILRNQDEIDLLTILIDDLKPSKPLLNQFDNVYQLLTHSLQNVQHNELRDILLDSFRTLSKSYPFQKIIYINQSNNDLLLYHFSKDLLLEKTLKDADLKDTVIESFINQKISHKLLGQTGFIHYTKGLYKDHLTKYVFINGIQREDTYDYFVVYSKDLDDFDFQQKLILITHELLKKQIHDFDTYTVKLSNYKNYKTLLEHSDFGLIKIENNIIHIQNQYTKNLLQTSQDYLKYEDFQNNLEDPLFIDELLSHKTVEVKYMNRFLKLYIHADHLDIYIVLQEVKDTYKSNHLNHLTNLPNEYQMVKDYAHVDPITVISCELRNYADYFKDYSSTGYLEEINHLNELIQSSAKQHLLGLYFTGYNNLYMVLKTIDKRVIKRITDDLIKHTQPFDLRLASIKVNHTLSKEHLIKLEYLISLTTEENVFISDNKNFRYNQELSKTVLTNVNTYIQRKQLPLNYLSIGDWQNKKINIIEITPSKKSGLLKQSSLKKILRSNHLSKQFDKVLVQSFVKDIQDLDLSYQFLLPISYQTIEDITELKTVIKLITSTLVSNQNIVLKIDLDEHINIDQFSKGIDLLKTRGINIAYAQIVHHLNIKYLGLFKYPKYIYYEIEDLDNANLERLVKVLDDYNIIKILNHSEKTITKTQLIQYDITYIRGASFPEYERLEQLNNHLNT